MIRDTTTSYGLVTILFHWIMAGLFAFQFWLGLSMMAETDMATKVEMRAQHISFGILILMLWAGRIVWRITSKRPELPRGMEKNLRGVARISHLALYSLLAVTPLAGWAIFSSKPLARSPEFFGLFPIPRLPVSISPNASGVWSGTHAFLAYMLLFLALVHALAALRHQFKDKDGLLTRMLIPGAQLKENNEER